jgi:phosphoribosylanthranilate isomerase
MNNKTVLVRDLTSLSEARYCSGMQVAYIAFEFNPTSENYISDTLRSEIIQWLSGVEIVGSFENGNLSEIKSCIETFELKNFLFENNQKDYVNTLVLDKKFLEITLENNLEIITEDIVLISNSFINRKNVLIGYDFNNPTLQSNADGFAFKGSKELRPGFNNYDELMDAFEAIENL